MQVDPTQSLLIDLLQGRELIGITTLQLKNHLVEMELGVLPEEQGVSQRIRFDIDLHISGAKAPSEDEIDRVLDYDFIKGQVDAAAEGPRFNLLESLVSDLLDSYLCPPEVLGASVTATKLDVYDGDAEIGCRMVRLRE
jgi:FolB domain-containing protein